MLGGVTATSNLAAGKAYGIPVSGTMAHSFIEACASEAEAFGAFARMLISRKPLYWSTPMIRLPASRRLSRCPDRSGLASRFAPFASIRATSINWLAESRRMLDDAGLTNVQIVASGGLDEDRIDRLTAGGAPIDLFGVGTDLAVSSDAPALDIAYKLVEYAGVGRMKLSVGKGQSSRPQTDISILSRPGSGLRRDWPSRREPSSFAAAVSSHVVGSPL